MGGGGAELLRVSLVGGVRAAIREERMDWEEPWRRRGWRRGLRSRVISWRSWLTCDTCRDRLVIWEGAGHGQGESRV